MVAKAKSTVVLQAPKRAGRGNRRAGPPKSGLSRFLGYLTLIVFCAALFGFIGGFFFWTLSDLPKIQLLEEYAPLQSSFIYSSDNELLAELFIERRTFVPYHKIPENVKNAFIAIEDVRFYDHKGIDFFRIIGALVKDIQARAFVQGGSTITQQLAKMLFLKPDRSITRKIKEAALSIQIERHYTKDEIIGLYLNQTYFGTRAYGIEAAANTYFGKKTEEITTPEAALLAALPKAPSAYSPFKNPKKAITRRNYVLSRMLENGFISDQQYKDAINELLPTAVFTRKYKTPYFIDYVRSELEAKYGDKLYSAGLKIHTTLDFRMQRIAEQAVAYGLEELDKRGRTNVQAALIAIDLKTGGIRAMVGGTDFWETQFNRATQAMRQPGSAFKPVVYLTAFNEGLTPDDIIQDSPISFPGGRKGEVWIPKNYTREYNGPVTVKFALTKSLNAATVYLANAVGLKDVIETAKTLGIKSKIQPYMPSVLGSSDVTPIEMTYAYGAFAYGKKLDRVFFTTIEDREGMLLEESVYPQKVILDQKAVDDMREVLRSVVVEGTARKAASLPRPVYGKTGTTNDYTDAWFIGFDDNIVVGVWVGRDNHKPIGDKETGSRAALPIWMEFMKNI